MLDRIIEPTLGEDLYLPFLGKINDPNSEELIKEIALMYLKRGLEKLKYNFRSDEVTSDEVIITKRLRRSLNTFDTDFIVNVETSNDNDIIEGRTDLKLQASRWKKYFVFECKKLDGGSDLSRDYIIKGLVRFCNGKYGVDFDGSTIIHERTPNFGGMIGYVVKGEISTILDDIRKQTAFHGNGVNFGQICTGSLDLFEKVPYFDHSFKSKHKRVIITSSEVLNNLDGILIYHIFFDLT
jgi:hypothetical protein